MPGRAKVGIGAVALIVIAAFPAAAAATTYCVSDPACVSAGGTSEISVQAALTAAQTNPGPDRVEIGAGSFNSGPTGFSYSSGIAGNHVDIIGEGSDQTTLTAPVQAGGSGIDTLFVSSVPASGDFSTVSDLAVVMAGASSGSPYNRGLNVTGAASRVAVTSKPAPNPTVAGEAVSLDGTLADSTVQTDHAISGGVAVRVSDGDLGTITDSTLSGFYGVYGTSSTGTQTTEILRRVRVDAGYGGIYTFGVNVSAEDVLIELDPSGIGILADTDGDDDATTVFGNGTITGGATSAQLESDNAGRTATMSINSSILEGAATSLSRSASTGTANLTASYSNYSPPVTSSGPGTLTQSQGNTSVADPGFADPGVGLYQLLAGSPLIDRGDPAALVAGESTRDLDLNPRVVGGRRDMGAFEFQLTCRGKSASMVGTAAGETLVGTAGADVIAALGGADKVRGRGGKDLVCGGGARDRLIGGGGGDTLLGQAGGDVLRGGAGRDRLLGGQGRDRLLGGGGRDRLRGGPGRDLQVQ